MHRKNPFTVTLVVIISFLFSSCNSGQELEPTLTPSLKTTDTLIPTNTLTPTMMPTPSPTPILLGGGGHFIMSINQLLIPEIYKNTESISEESVFSWFSASSDGSNLTPLDYQIWSISPDRKRALTYTQDRKVSLTNTDGSGSIPLDDSIAYYIYNSRYRETVKWLPNGKLQSQIPIERIEKRESSSQY